jgi:hypothetical protein
VQKLFAYFLIHDWLLPLYLGNKISSYLVEHFWLLNTKPMKFFRPVNSIWVPIACIIIFLKIPPAQFYFLFIYYYSLALSSELAPTLEHRADFSVSQSFTDARTPWTGDHLVARPLPKHRTIQTQKNAHTYQTSMPWVGFEPTIPASERAKTVNALDHSDTVTGAVFFKGRGIYNHVEFNQNRYNRFRENRHFVLWHISRATAFTAGVFRYT